jgi:hypothetical protein
MTAQKPAWGASPAVGTMLAQLANICARALRVDAARKAQRMERLAKLIERRNRK